MFNSQIWPKIHLEMSERTGMNLHQNLILLVTVLKLITTFCTRVLFLTGSDFRADSGRVVWSIKDGYRCKLCVTYLFVSLRQ